MWCLQDQLFILCIALSCVTRAAGLIRVTGYEGGEAKVPCPYGEGYQTYEKYLCRNDCGGYDVLITTTQGNNRYSIYDDKQKRVFTATISGLSQMDAGKYWCGVTRTGKDIYTEVKLDIVTDTCCDSVKKIQRYEGGSVPLSCRYDPEYQNNQKYMCRGNRPSTCLQQAVVTSKNKQSRQYSLTDDKERRTFTVTITGLAQRDSGLYLCGIHKNTGLDALAAFELEVKENRCCDHFTKIQSYEGGSVSISCQYDPENQNNQKYMCRGNRPSTCLQQAVVTSNNKQTGQYSLTDDKERRTFTVTVTGLAQRDSGLYLCGVHRNTGLDVFSAVELEVKAWCCVKSNNLKGIVGRPVTLKCPYPRHHGTNRKFLCKGDHRSNCTHMVTSHNNSGQTDLRFTLQDDAASSSFSVMITELEAGDAGTYWCGSDSQWSVGNYTQIQLSVDFLTSTMETVVSTPVLGTSVTDTAPFHSVVVIVSAVVLLILILTAVIVIIYKYKCCELQGAGVNRNRDTAKAGDAGMVMDEADIYENQDVVDCSKHRLRKQHITCHHDDETGGDQQDSVYQNFTTAENIYCNDVSIKFSKR